MFTGLIDAVGTVISVEPTTDGRRLRVGSNYRDVAIGESIAVHGVCLTALEIGDGWFDVAAVNTTIGRTAIGSWQVGQRVNLERAMRAGDRFGGHLVQGHVDAVGQVTAVRDDGDARLVNVRVSDAIWPLLVPHGSIAVDGVSLTVNALPAANVVQLSLIGHTRRVTTLDALVAGDAVHVEGDVVGKYIQRLVGPYARELPDGSAARAGD